MPYRSRAQQRKFHADPKLKKYAPEFDEATKHTKKGFKGLPEKVKKKVTRKKRSPKKKSTPKKKK